MRSTKYALVIGNSNYLQPPVKKLRNPINDAKAIAASLQKCGYHVTLKEDLKAGDFANVVIEFEQAADGADVAIVFYSGHGISYNAKNFLLPIDAQLLGRVDFDKFVSVEDVINRLARVSDRTVFFFDACRNALESGDEGGRVENLGSNARKISVGTIELASGMTEFSLNQGLGELFIYFATSPNSVARDGTGANSPFVEALLENINIPGLLITDLSSRVNNSVREKTKNIQRPWPINLLSRPLHIRERSLFPVIATIVAGIVSGLLIVWFGKTDFLRLWNIDLLPGVLFAAAMLIAFRVTGTQVEKLLFLLVTLAIWFACSLLYPYLNKEMTNYVTQLDPSSLVSTDENFDQRTASYNFFHNYGGAVIGFVVGTFGALLLMLGTALAVVRARNVSIGILATFGGGIAPMLAFTLHEILGFSQSRYSLAVFIWQSLMAFFIGLSLAYCVPSNENKIAIYFQRPVLRYSSVIFLILAVASGLASTSLTLPYPQALMRIAHAMMLLGVPFGSSIVFGLQLGLIALTRRSSYVEAAAVALVTQLAWFCAFRSAIYLDGGIEGRGLSIEIVFAIAGFIGASILVAGFWLFRPSIRNWLNLLFFPLLGVVATIPYTYFSPELLATANGSDILNFSSLVILFVPWQVAITAAFIHSYDVADRSAF